MVSGSGEKSNERAYLSIIAALYMRIPEVGSVMTCPVLRLISQLMSLEPISRALDPRCLVTKREAMTMSAWSCSSASAMAGMNCGICWPSESNCTAAS